MKIVQSYSPLGGTTLLLRSINTFVECSNRDMEVITKDREAPVEKKLKFEEDVLIVDESDEKARLFYHWKNSLCDCFLNFTSYSVAKLGDRYIIAKIELVKYKVGSNPTSSFYLLYVYYCDRILFSIDLDAQGYDLRRAGTILKLPFSDIKDAIRYAESEVDLLLVKSIIAGNISEQERQEAKREEEAKKKQQNQDDQEAQKKQED